MKNLKKYLLFASLFLIPGVVNASSGEESFSLVFAIAMEAFVSMHMSVFVFKPLSEMISKNDSQTAY